MSHGLDLDVPAHVRSESDQICRGKLTLKNLSDIYKPYLIWFSSLRIPHHPKSPSYGQTACSKYARSHSPLSPYVCYFHCLSMTFFSSLSSENSFNWHTDHPSVDESLISGCASYRAFERYLEGNDLFLLPRTRGELESILSVPSPFVDHKNKQ